MLVDLRPAGVSQGDLFQQEPEAPTERRSRLLSVMDTINAEMGRVALRFSAEGVEQPWKMRRENLTSHFRTAWEGLLVVAA